LLGYERPFLASQRYFPGHQGVGLLGLPYAFAKAGLIGGLFSIVAMGFITWKTSIMIGRELNGDPRPASYFDDSPWKTPLQPGSVPQARMLRPISSFPDIARAAFGEIGCVILSVILYFELFSCICIFIVTIGDHMHTIFPSIPIITHMIGVGVVSTIPVLLLRTARLLSYLSMIGTFATICVVGAVILAFTFEGDISEDVAAKMSPTPSPPFHALWHGEGLVVSFGLVAYCFSGHAIVPSIYSSMQKPQEFETVVNLTFTIVLAACLTVGLSGYLMFGELVFDQITISLEQNSSATLAMTVLTYLMVLTAFSKLTLTMFPLAIGMEEIAAPYVSSETTMEVTSAVIKVALLMLALAVAICVPSFSFLCSLVGMICTMTVSVVFPAAAYLQMFGKKMRIAEKALCWLFVIGGMIMAVAGTVLSVG
jgi:vesicular inhibitory amino acid transporter